MKIQQFNGGLSNRLDPQFIKSNQSVVNVNIDNSSGVLAPVKDKSPTSITVNKYFKYFEKEDKYVSNLLPTDYVEFQGFMYYTDGVNRPMKQRNDRDNFLGIKRPQVAPSLVNEDNTSKLAALSFESKPTAELQGTAPGNPDLTIPVTGNLPHSALKYLVFIQELGTLSVGYEVTIGGTLDNSEIDFEDRYSRYDIDRGYDFTPTKTTLNQGPRLIEISDINVGAGESVVVYRQYLGEWKFVGKSSNYPIVDDVFNISARDTLQQSQITAFNGTYQYVYTFYNANDGTESAPSDLSEELRVESGYIQVTVPDLSTDNQVTHKRIYRIGNNLAVFTLVAEINKDLTFFEDSIPDTEVDGRTLQSENYFEAPTGLKYLTEAYGMLFGALGTELRFTPIGKPNAWPPEYSLQFSQELTGIGAVANGLLVMTRHKTHIVIGNGPFTLSVQPLRGDQGCISHKSIQQVEKGAIVWASQDGLCVSSGNNVKNITKYQLGDLKFDPTSSAVLNEVYYLHNKDGIIFSWDYRFEPVFKQLNLGVEYIQTANNSLLGYQNSSVFKLLDAGLLPYEYLSPRFIEGSFTERKTYNKFFIHHNGEIDLTIYINDEQVYNQTWTGKASRQIKIPQHCQAGQYVQFKIIGTGIVNEIEYLAGRSKND